MNFFTLALLAGLYVLQLNAQAASVAPDSDTIVLSRGSLESLPVLHLIPAYLRPNEQANLRAVSTHIREAAPYNLTGIIPLSSAKKALLIQRYGPSIFARATVFELAPYVPEPPMAVGPPPSPKARLEQDPPLESRYDRDCIIKGMQRSVAWLDDSDAKRGEAFRFPHVIAGLVESISPYRLKIADSAESIAKLKAYSEARIPELSAVFAARHEERMAKLKAYSEARIPELSAAFAARHEERMTVLRVELDASLADLPRILLVAGPSTAASADATAGAGTAPPL